MDSAGWWMRGRWVVGWRWAWSQSEVLMQRVWGFGRLGLGLGHWFCQGALLASSYAVEMSSTPARTALSSSVVGLRSMAGALCGEDVTEGVD